MAQPTSLPFSPHAPFVDTNLLEHFTVPHHLPAMGDLLDFCYHMGPGEAALFVIFGVVFLLFGINIYKFLVMLNAGIAGAGIGAWLGEKAGNQGVGAVVGGFIAAALSWPMMKHAVAILGAAVGCMLGTAVWRVADLQPDMVWAGALCGAVLLGMLSFTLFRGCVMMFTSLQGAMMIAMGVLALTYKYPDLAPKITATLSAKSYILPVAVFLPALVGLIYQQTPSAPAGAAKPPVKK